jgi:MFS family permease
MTDASTASAGTRLWRDRNFNTFWVAQAFDFLGDSLALILMPLLVLQATGSVSQMGLVTACQSAGTAVAGISSGALIDRVDRRKLMIACDVSRAAFYAVIPLAWALGILSVGLIYPVAIAAAVATGCFLITYSAATPRLVSRDQISHANGRLQATIALTYVAGPTLAGLGAQLTSPAVVISALVGCYALSALGMTRVRMGAASFDRPAARAGSTISEFLVGVRFLWGHPVLRAVTVLFALFTLVSQAAIDLFVYHLSRDLGQDRRTVGLAFGIGALGAVLGGALTPVLRRKLGFGPSFLGALILQGLAMAAVGLAPGLVPLILLITGFSFGFTLRNASTMSIRQQLTPDHMLGRTTAAFWALASIASPVGTTLATRSAQTVGAPAVLGVMGVAGIVLGVIGFFTAAQHDPLRGREPDAGPAPEAAEP